MKEGERMIEVLDIDGVTVDSGEETPEYNSYEDGFRTGFKCGCDYAVKKISNELARKVSDELVEKILKAKGPE